MHTADTAFVSLADYLRDRPVVAETAALRSVPVNGAVAPAVRPGSALVATLKKAAVPSVGAPETGPPSVISPLFPTPTEDALPASPSPSPSTRPPAPMDDAEPAAPPSAGRSSSDGVPSDPLLVIAPRAETPDQLAAIREARLFRAALGDAFDALAVSLTRELAAVVVGRELRLAPVDIESIARRLIAQQRAEEPLCLRVAPGDAHISCELPVVPDERLQPGDAILECRSGEIDARMRVRLAHACETVEW